MAKFVYHARTAEQAVVRANQQGGLYDNITKDGYKVWRPAEGDNTIRIMPKTYAAAKHYGEDVFSHSDIGTEKQQYLCLEKMEKGPCPICEYRRTLEAERSSKNADAIKALQPRKSVIVWIIDRKNEKDGPLLYLMGYTMDKTISKLTIDPADGSVLLIEAPDNGYDVSFRRTGTRRNTKYDAESIARRESPLAATPKRQTEILDYIAANPLLDCLNYYDYDHINRMLQGQPGPEDDAGTDDDTPAPRQRLRDTNASNAAANDELTGVAPARAAAARVRPAAAETEAEVETDPPPPRRARAVAAPPPAEEPEEELPYEDEEQPTVDATGRTPARRYAAEPNDDGEFVPEDEPPPPPPRRAAAAAPARRPAAPPVEPEEPPYEDEPPPPPPPRRAAAAPVAARKPAAPPVEPEEEVFEEEAPPAPVARRAAVAPAAAAPVRRERLAPAASPPAAAQARARLAGLNRPR